jgi:predicted transcriptional regulator
LSTILLSIKPEYAEKILNGTKKYEFRRHLAKNNVTRIIIYSTFPIKQIVGEVEVTGTLSMKPHNLWDATKEYAGIARSGFRKYFSGCTIAHAYKLGNVYKYSEPQSLLKYNIKHPPQSFVYIGNEPDTEKFD